MNSLIRPVSQVSQDHQFPFSTQNIQAVTHGEQFFCAGGFSLYRFQ
jgi:hypothetical protein